MADQQPAGPSGPSSRPLLQLPHDLHARIPNEIIDCICLQQGDLPTLRSLRLVNSSFNVSATKAMFSHLDISLGVRSLMQLEFIAFSPPLARLVQSVRIRGPRKVSNIGPHGGDEFEFNEDNSGYVHTNLAIDNVAQISTSLARSLRQLSSVQILEFAVGSMLKRYDDDWDAELRGAVFKALQSTLPPKLRCAVLRFRDKDEARDVCDVHGQLVRRILATVSDLNIEIKVFEEEEQIPDVDIAGFWRALAEHGTQLKRLKLVHTGRPWVVEKGLTYSFENLEVLDLYNVEFDNSDFFKALGTTSTALITVKLSRIRLCNGKLSEIFEALRASKSIIQLELYEFMTTSEWRMHERIVERYYEEEELGPWLTYLPQLWNMVCSSGNYDLRACRDLLLAVNENRKKAGFEPAFRAGADASKVKIQSEWLLMPGPGEEDGEEDEEDGEEELSSWQDGSGNWAEGLHRVWRRYPLVRFAPASLLEYS